MMDNQDISMASDVLVAPYIPSPLAAMVMVM